MASVMPKNGTFHFSPPHRTLLHSAPVHSVRVSILPTTSPGSKADFYDPIRLEMYDVCGNSNNFWNDHHGYTVIPCYTIVLRRPH